MKFCRNCGTQLADDAIFCDECGTRIEEATVVQAELEEIPQIETRTGDIVHDVEPKLKEIKLSDTCKPSKRQMKGWLLVVLLLVCSPLILFELIWWLPDFLFTIVFFGVQLVVLVVMWRKRTWKTWIKLMWTLAYIIMLFI